MRSRGIDVMDLSLGEPDFDTPEHIREAAKLAIDEGYTHYTPVGGYVDVRESIIKKLKRDNDLDYTFEQIILSTGAKQSIANVVLSVLDEGDEAIIPAPYWISYLAQVQLAGGVSVVIPTEIEQNYKITPEQLQAAITPKSKLFIFSSPCNPSGAIYSHEELAGLVAVFEQHPNIVIISDEIYEYINFVGKHASIASFESIKNRVVVINGLSKGFAMTGWRLGYIAAPIDIARACAKMQGQFTSATCSITQRATIAAMAHYDSTITDMVAEFKARKSMVEKRLKAIPGLRFNDPDGAFYFFPDVSYYFGAIHNDTTINDSTDLVMYLLKEAKVALVSGNAFGNNNCLRISYATNEAKLTEAFNRIETAFAALTLPEHASVA
jgi:aspartate aminotransferase